MKSCDEANIKMISTFLGAVIKFVCKLRPWFVILSLGADM